ncbi:Aste57867_24094 [Aphanomyces stellatus]|uniref:Aste57867_24094 protein n=1 Tax=Aphanomyces stellatus TaxID=120398 RepID=A0A485LR39_9STRA|nr:hypothetical protein As57867_024021 [Aphanomyces stellatus]VFU00736.1 Aste57867_24094 [Aphanomyces stellatus]
MTAPTPTAPGLVVFDYDWSLINCNSDTYIFEQRQPDLMEHLRQLCKDGLKWTQAIDQTLAKLTCTKQELLDTIARVPVQPGMLDAVHLAHEKGWDVVIVSDANTDFIRSMLELHGLTSIIQQVYTNHSEFIGDILHVTPFHPLDQPPHGCPRCPPNMCKGSIVQGVKSHKQYAKILYIGDGGGDFCPSVSQLSSHDVVFAREAYELQKQLIEQKDQVAAIVVPWNTGYDILAGFQAHLG